MIECQGDYWHTKEMIVRKDKAKHSYIEKYYSEQYELAYLWEHEFYAFDKVYRKLNNWLGVNIDKKLEVDLAKLEVRRVGPDIARELVENYHYLNGLGRGGYFVACFDGEVPIAAAVFASLAQPNVAEHYGQTFNTVRELSRFVIRPDYQVKNLGSWFLSRAVNTFKKDNPEIQLLVSYADMTYGHGGALYKASNWEFCGEVPADYWYACKEGYIIKKQKVYQHAKKLGKTESAYVEEMGWKKIYGLEKLRFIKKL